MNDAIRKIVERIGPLDRSALAEARDRLDSLTKPPGSLGRLEDLAAQIYAVQGKSPIAADPALVVVAAGDHGVTARGVSPFPQEVTRQMVANFLSGGAAVSAMCREVGVDLMVVDAGCAGGEFAEHEKLLQAKIAEGAADISRGPAMNREQCARALALGAGMADRAQAGGVRSVALGEMGIGNTTSAAALYCALFGLDPREICGPGTGLDREGVALKARIVGEALEANAGAAASGDGFEILASLGGYEIAVLAGLALGAAANDLLVFVDGYIATAAFACAWRVKPEAKGYAIFAHTSAEPGHAKALEAMNAKPLLDLGMRLGEGTGAVLAIQLARQACAIFNNMATFEQAGVSGK
jgi:nicotinate-nucleotide--dimethylbenzimidazole phosphoribosyltransferase